VALSGTGGVVELCEGETMHDKLLAPNCSARLGEKERPDTAWMGNQEINLMDRRQIRATVRR
jgi:hypothetical protein